MRKAPVFVIVVGSLLSMATGVHGGAELDISSGGTDITVVDNGPGDTSSSTVGQILWAGTLNGWNFTVTVGDSKPLLGSATSPQLDLSVIANSPGNGNLTVKLTDTDFGPTSGLLNSTFFQNGTSTASSQFLVDPNNQPFGGSPSTDITLTGPYSITLVDTFTVGTISSDQRVSAVPDGGATVAFLGVGLLGVEGFRRGFCR